MVRAGASRGLGHEFLAESNRGLASIAVSPTRWPFVRGSKSVRRFLLDRFPYSLVYVILDAEVVVLAVAHAKRRPGYWRRRRPTT